MLTSSSENQLSDDFSLYSRFNTASVSERLAAGKALRQRVKRCEHGVYQPAENREDPIAILEAQAKTRLSDLVPIRYGLIMSMT